MVGSLSRRHHIGVNSSLSNMHTIAFRTLNVSVVVVVVFLRQVVRSRLLKRVGGRRVVFLVKTMVLF